MPNDHAASVQGVKLRVTKLGIDGRPVPGDQSTYVTSAFMRLSFTPEYAEGEEVEEKAADGSVCISYKMPDTLKRVALELAICSPDPELYEILAGGMVIKDELDNIVGWQAPPLGTEPNPNGCSVEVWSKAIVNGKPAADLPYWRWVFPYVKTRMSGERVLENGAMANTFEGWGTGNEPWAPGPGGDAANGTGWLYDSSAAYQYARDSKIPSGNGYVPVVAGAARTPLSKSADPGDQFSPIPGIANEDEDGAAALTAAGYTPSDTELTAWADGDAITVGTLKFHWDGTKWAPGVAPANP